MRFGFTKLIVKTSVFSQQNGLYVEMETLPSCVYVLKGIQLNFPVS